MASQIQREEALAMKKAQHRWLWLALAIALTMSALVVVSACGSGEEEVAATPAGTPPAAAEVIQIKMGEMFFHPDAIALKEGQPVQIELVNDGIVEHEFMVGREARPAPGGYAQDLFQGVDVQFTGEKAKLEREEGHGTEVMVGPGGRGVITFTVPKGMAGEWEMGCFVPGHYEAGMKGKLIVTKV